MSIFVSKDKLRGQLTAVASECKPGPVIVHSDLLKVGIIDRMKLREKICRDYEDLLLDVFAGRELLIPTFNYDFCRNGEYDLATSPGQVGAFSEYMTKRHSHLRTRTPVFNFCIFNNQRFNRDEVVNPFGEDSAFGKVRSLGGSVIFLGASFDSNTFLHFVEESVPIGYRYLKKFKGCISEDGKDSPWQIDYRVRPLESGAVDYDWERIQANLREEGILNEAPAGHGRVLWYNSGDLFDFWIDNMRAEPLYLLTDNSRRITRDLYKRHGEPLTLEKVEQRGA